MHTLLPTRTWQRYLTTGGIKRNSRFLRPTIWLIQQMKISKASRRMEFTLGKIIASPYAQLVGR